ncbi:hypothetical protein SteCoe_27931 [Stentor coeruleus]|uniref:Uncharacterized protein n=1 Tax=Stentor coeruleus TaxID=5963 RepID=A0A1R2B9F9_9CILI|nr:hypothetical protein SteCoe_27931 [Stentor coeruleus]
MSENHDQLVPCRRVSQFSLESLYASISSASRRVSQFSLESLYASISSANISLPSRQISRDSCTASLLNQKNDQIKDLLTNRITALHYFAKELTTELTEEVEFTTTKENVSLLEKPYNDEVSINIQENSIKGKELLEKIYILAKEFKKERKRLDEDLVKVSEINDEEEFLKERIDYYEKEISSILLEKKNINSGCQCRLF